MSEISTVDLNTLQPDQVWDLVINDKLKWLQHFYQKNGVKSKVEESIQPLLKQLKESIKKSQFNSGEKYFAKFKQIQGQKLHPMLIQFDKIQLSFQQKQKSERKKENIQKNSLILEEHIIILKDYRHLLLNNHKQIIKFLTGERYSLSHIAQHVYQKNAQKDKSFFFFVEKGHPIDKTQELSIGLLYVLVKNLTKGISQLRKQGIIHLDLDLQNILLFCFYNIYGLKKLKQLNLSNPKQLVKIIDKIIFKFIDFGNAFVINNKQLKQSNQKLIQKRAQISKYFIINDMFTSKFQNDKLLMTLVQQQNGHLLQGKVKQIYQNGFTRIIQMMTNKIKSFDPIILNQTNQQGSQQESIVLSHQEKIKLLLNYLQQFKGKYARMFQQGKYQQIIDLMDKKITKFKKQHSS